MVRENYLYFPFKRHMMYGTAKRATNLMRCGTGMVSHTTLMLSYSPDERLLLDTPVVSKMAIGVLIYWKRAPF